MNNEGVTSLIKACEKGHLEVSLAVSSIMLGFEFTPHCSQHHDQVARALMENGAAVNSQNKNGIYALMLSAQSGHEQVRRTRMPSIERVVRTA